MKEKSYKIMEKLPPTYISKLGEAMKPEKLSLYEFKCYPTFFSKLKEAIKLIEQYELHLMRHLMMNLKGYEFKGIEVEKKAPPASRKNVYS
jgi:hypothetical protein